MSHKSNLKPAKYRPVLTAQQILHLLNLAKLEEPLSEVGCMCISTLSVYKTKIENAGVKAAYIPKPYRPKINSLEALGESSIESIFIDSMAKEEIWKLSYYKYKANPTECSLQEIKEAKEHMYLYDLMSSEEVVIFERDAFKESSNIQEKE